MLNNPIIVGGAGGSGTRMVSRILRAYGVYLGQLNPTGDSIDFMHLIVKYNNASVLNNDFASYLSSVFIDKKPNPLFIERDLRRSCEEFNKGWNQSGRCGVKFPTIMLALDALVKYFDDFTYIHVIRDGRDMVLSSNKQEFYMWSKSVIGDVENTIESRAKFWAFTNKWVIDFLRERNIKHHVVRYEDLCRNMDTERNKIVNFCGLGRLIRPQLLPIPRTNKIGRHKSQDIGDSLQYLEPTLKEFGY